MNSKKDISIPAPLGLSPEAAALKPKAAEKQGTEKQGAKVAEQPMPPEKGGPKGPEPTRYGDWERKGRCSDF
jgi:hypothetical protein